MKGLKKGVQLWVKIELPGSGPVGDGRGGTRTPFQLSTWICGLNPTDLISLIATCTNYLRGARWLGGAAPLLGDRSGLIIFGCTVLEDSAIRQREGQKVGRRNCDHVRRDKGHWETWWLGRPRGSLSRGFRPEA